MYCRCMARPPADPDVFSAIAHPRRREILSLLASGDRVVADLVAAVGVSQPTVSEHLAALKSIGLVRSSKRGRERLYRLDTTPLRDVTDWISMLEGFWDERIRRLGQLLERIDGEGDQ